MRGKVRAKNILGIGVVACALLTQPHAVFGQSAAPAGGQKTDDAAIGAMLQQLQLQIQELHAQVNDLKEQQQSAKAESAELRKELEKTKSQLLGQTSPVNYGGSGQVAVSTSANGVATKSEEQITKLEENQQLSDSKIAEQSQSKVESGSKYRVRLTGIALFNLYANRSMVDNQDFPQLATAADSLDSNGSFGASLRQSQVGIQAFGPTIAGARTSADVQFDFAGGFPEIPNGVSFGAMRLRTGTVRFDWPTTSVIAGQDTLFFAPNTPTSIATLAVPALAYSGNLWSWTPQVRVEKKLQVTENGSLLLQGGILDSLSGDIPESEYYRYPSWGEQSGMPAFASRVAWTQKIHGQNLTVGVGGYYGRQDWGLSRNVDGWAGTLDVSVPLGARFEFTGEFFRGRAMGGLGEGFGQSVLWNGSLVDPTTELWGLNAVGGWAQLKFKATPKLQFNGAFGQDNPYADDLREYGGNISYYPVALSKNQTGFVNFIYQPRSDVVLSLEYRKIRTYALDSNANTANLVNLSVGYIF
jgi:regulator of replication initiation timing